MDSGGYTYVCLEKKGKKTWVAVPQMKVKRGRTCLFSPAFEMVNFKSKTSTAHLTELFFPAGDKVTKVKL